MQQRLTLAGVALALAATTAACGGDNSNVATGTNTKAVTNVNTNTAVMPTSAGEVRMGPDNSEILSTTADGVTTETRTFKDPGSPVERVVVTTRAGKRTARVYYRDRSVRELPDNAVEGALVTTADKLEDAGGKVVDVSKDVAGEAADKAEDVGARTADGAKKVGSEAADKAEDAAGKAASGAKKAGEATVKGAKKVGGAVKDAVTP